MEMASAFTLNVRLDNVAVVTIDVPGEKMNTLKAEFAGSTTWLVARLRWYAAAAAPDWRQYRTGYDPHRKTITRKTGAESWFSG